MSRKCSTATATFPAFCFNRRALTSSSHAKHGLHRVLSSLNVNAKALLYLTSLDCRLLRFTAAARDLRREFSAPGRPDTKTTAELQVQPASSPLRAKIARLRASASLLQLPLISEFAPNALAALLPIAGVLAPSLARSSPSLVRHRAAAYATTYSGTELSHFAVGSDLQCGSRGRACDHCSHRDKHVATFVGNVTASCRRTHFRPRCAGAA